MAIKTPEAFTKLERQRATLEKSLPGLHLNNKMVWVYLLSKLGYIDRHEVKTLTQLLTEDYNSRKTEGVNRSLAQLCSDAQITRRDLNPLRKDPFLQRVYLTYDPPYQPLDELIAVSIREARRPLRAVDIISGGSKPLKDLFALEGFGEVNIERRPLEKLDPDTGLDWEERFVLTNQGSQHAWLLHRLVEHAVIPLIKRGNLAIITDRYVSKAISLINS